MFERFARKLWFIGLSKVEPNATDGCGLGLQKVTVLTGGGLCFFGRCLLALFVALTSLDAHLTQAGSPDLPVGVGNSNQPDLPVNLDLSGAWEVLLDPQDRFDPSDTDRRGSSRSDRFEFLPIRLPGSLRENELGDLVGPSTQWIGGIKEELWSLPKYAPYRTAENFKMPFWWQPQRHYVGTAWYRRAVEIPTSWQGQRIELLLERPHWQTEVWIDGQQCGKNDSLGTAHRFDLTRVLTAGQHSLVLKVNNSVDAIDVGINSHSVSDHTQTAWHGIVGDLRLTACPTRSVGSMVIRPSEDGKSVKVTLDVRNDTGGEVTEQIRLRISHQSKVVAEEVSRMVIPAGGSPIEMTVNLEQPARKWNEFSPHLYQLEAALLSQANVASPKTTSFGFRNVIRSGRQLLLNGKPLFLRGTLDCCVFPLTGYPPTDIGSWRRIIGICKRHGLNHIRFHSWCPPEAAFVAADQMGFYFQVECSSWPNQSTTVGDGKPVDDWLMREADRVIAAYGNHPSFLLLAAGNEPGGKRQNEYLGAWVSHQKNRDDRFLVTSGSGWPSIPENQFQVITAPRIQQWGQGLRSRINSRPPETTTDYRQIINRFDQPVVGHEIGQWCSFPDFEEMKKYTGQLKLRNYEVFQEFLEQASMQDQAKDFVMASGALQELVYKEEIEAALRTPGMAGFQLLDMRDFPGQGTATVGMLDAFWDSKPYHDPDQFRKYCGPIVPLARMANRTWKSNQTFVAEIEVSHFGPNSLSSVEPRWTISSGGQLLGSGALTRQNIEAGGLRGLGKVVFPLSAVKDASKLTLSVSIKAGDETVANDWDFWVYPESDPASHSSDVASSELLIATEFDQATIDRLADGGKVLLIPEPASVETDVVLGFSPIFWNTAWTDNQPPHTLGILCDPTHPALRDFPTSSHSDWQWWELISRGRTLDLDSMPKDLLPIVQVVPDWFSPQRLGLAIEANVGKGRLLVCSIDLTGNLTDLPAAEQFRRSLIKYASSEAWNPVTHLSVDQVADLFREPSLLHRLGTKVTTDSHQMGFEGEKAIDGDLTTMWHTTWTPKPAPLPHQLTLQFRERNWVSAIRCLPRQDQANGRITEYRILTSQDGQEFRRYGTGKWAGDGRWKQFDFPKPVFAKAIRIESLSSASGDAYTSLAEIDIVLSHETSVTDK